MSPLRRKLLRWPLLFGSGALLLAWPGMLPNLFSDGDFMPHGHCYLWTRELVVLLVASDVAIALSYIAISMTLTYLVWKARQDIPFRWMFLAFGVFIISCGFTHLVEVWNVWHGHYWFAGFVKLVTAVASVATAVLLPRLVPEALELGRASRLARERKAELEQRSEELEAFAYSAAHDMKAPMRRIQTFAGVVEEKTLDAESLDALERIKANARKMSELVEALISSARLNSAPIQRRTVDASRVAEQAAVELARQEPGRRVDVRIQPGMLVSADPVLFESILGNLLGNAWKYSRPAPEALIEFFREESGEREYVVRDNGVGFPDSESEKLFRPFHRLHSEAEFPGAGIGLSTVRKLVERHGGRVRARARPEGGAEFRFTLPA